MILLDRVTKTYGKGSAPALDRISLHVEPREFVIVVGSSGAGKTTLLKLLTREEKPTSGKIIVGGAVKGGDIYGKMPTLAVDGPDDTTQGRWIPTTSVDEYAATLATWFGVSTTDLPLVLPNIGRFAKSNLGFLG